MNSGLKKCIREEKARYEAVLQKVHPDVVFTSGIREIDVREDFDEPVG
jgi:hypothetical protein